MSLADLDLARWRSLDSYAVRRLATEIADNADAELVAVHQHQFSGASGWVALYHRDDAVYAFVPGGEVQVGFEMDGFTPTPAQTADYARWPVGGADIRAFVDSMTSPRRTVHLPALLVAVEATEAGSKPAGVDDPRIHQALEYLQGNWEHYQPPGVIGHEDWGRVEVMVNERCEITSARLVEYTTREELTADLNARGLRLPTPHEWEYACGAGAETLFRWGNHHPPDRYPTDRNPADWNQHRQSNTFGLNIGHDPYHPEQTDDPMVYCGGDGGRAICGGYGFFTSWLTLATSYRDRPYDGCDEDDDELPEDGHDAARRCMIVRPVIQLH